MVFGIGKKSDVNRIQSDIALLEQYRATADRELARLNSERQRAIPSELPSLESSSQPTQSPYAVHKEAVAPKEQELKSIAIENWCYSFLVNLEAINAKLDVLVGKKMPKVQEEQEEEEAPEDEQEEEEPYPAKKPKYNVEYPVKKNKGGRPKKQRTEEYEDGDGDEATVGA